MAETILVVDDEEPVRRTFRDWLTEADLGCTILTAGDAEEALHHAQAGPIDLAVLDWNLGTGMDGLQLLEDLAVFWPDVVAILVTGYAHQATPLMALRMGVRDYLDKSHELTRESFVAAVRKQLAKILPAKRHREVHAALASFRSAVEQVLPLVQSSAALTEPVPVPRAAAALCGFLCEITGATDAALIVRANDATRAFGQDGTPLPAASAEFARTLAASALGMGQPCALNNLDAESLAGIELQPFESGRTSVLAAPLALGGGVSAVLELFDKTPPGFSESDRRQAGAAAVVGTALMQQALADRTERQTLFAAVEAALQAAEQMPAPGAPPIPEPVRESLRAHLDQPGAVIGGSAALDLAEAVQALATRHGESAIAYARRLIVDLTRLLDEVTG